MRKIEKLKDAYIDQYYENARIIDYKDLDEPRGLKKVLYKDINKENLKGFYPYASAYVDKDYNVVGDSSKGDLCFYFLPNLHELYIGTTGSGKTTGCVEPQLRAVSSYKDKPNLFLTDPKGELFERNAKDLADKGYDIFLLNFKDAKKSDRWNPLLEMYDAYIQLKNVSEYTMHHVKYNEKDVDDLIRYDNIEDYNDFEYYSYDGYAFGKYDSLSDYIYARIDGIKMTTEDLVVQFADMVIPVRDTKDPIWEEGANRLLKGIIYLMLEDSLDEDKNFTRDMMTLKTIRDLYNKLRTGITNRQSGGFVLHRDLPFNYKNEDDYSLELMRVVAENAPNTTRSYLGVFESAIQRWLNLKILSLTTGNTITLDDREKPFVIFLITRDYEKSDFQVAGLFIDWVYKKTLELVENGLTNRETHFILDEFGNIPEIRDFENKIATSRSRGIWFHLVIQSYDQLSHVYDRGTERRASIIKDNCNAQIFLGAQHYETKETFSKECGQHMIPTFESLINPSVHKFEQVRLLPVSKLDQIIPGTMYIKRLYFPVIVSNFVRSYLSKEFQHNNSNGFEIVNEISISFGASRYTYELPEVSSNEEPDFMFFD